MVVDSPPTGRIARFLDVTKAVSELAKGGPVHSQADGVVKLLHSDRTAIHLVTLLEALPIQETVEAIDELAELGLPIGSVIVNRNIPAYLARRAISPRPPRVTSTPTRCEPVLPRRASTLGDDDFAGLLTETHPARDPHRRPRRECRAARRARRPAARAARDPPTASTSAVCTNSPKH